jgi:hypothetical protein
MQRLFFRYTLLVLLCSGLFLTASAQREYPSQYPAQLKNTTNRLQSPPLLQLPTPELKPYLEEDKITENYKDIPWRFGIAIDTMLGLKDGVGIREGDLFLWELSIKMEKAISLNLNFDKFYLPEGAELSVQSLDRNDQIGVFNHMNNRPDSLFSIRPLKGSHIKMKLIVPFHAKEQVSLSVNQVIYGYKDLYEKAGGFGRSGNCNRNINCAEGKIWERNKRAVVMILADSNTRVCSGTLLNNVRKDSIPYVLSAAHCPFGKNAIYIFNYESSKCTPSSDGQLIHSLSGGRFRASNSASDFRLIELYDKIPLNYNPYFAGWSAVNQAPKTSTCIHHPMGDVKKISLDEDPAVSGSYNSTTQNTHWQINNWEIGTTETGSSGSSIFDQNQRVVGQLQGGKASCNIKAEDFFGKFSHSYDAHPDSNKQLKYWLDPDTTNLRIWDGFDPVPKPYDYDLAIGYFELEREYLCGTSTSFNISVLNLGNKSINNYSIKVYKNQLLDTLYSPTLTLDTDEAAEFTFELQNLRSSDTLLTFKVEISGLTDGDTTNNEKDHKILINAQPRNTYLQFRTDQYGSELRWEITLNQLVLHKGGPYPDLPTNSTGKIYYDTLCMIDSCFDFNLYDAYNDGFTGSFGNGFVLLQNPAGDTLLYENDFRSGYKKINFCDTHLTSITEVSNSLVSPSPFPNPVEKGNDLYFSKSKDKYAYELIAPTGQLIERGRDEKVSINIKDPSGLYLLRLYNLNSGAYQAVKIVVR